jgi:outer membrane protein
MIRLKFSALALAPLSSIKSPTKLKGKIMQKLFTAFLFTLLLMAPAYAQTATKILTVDAQKILKESTAAQDIRKQLDTQRDKYQAEIKKEEDKMRASEQEILKSRDKLTKEQLVEKQKALQSEFRSMESRVQQRKKALDSAYSQGMDKVQEVLSGIISAQAKAVGANIVLPKGATMWSAADLEITDAVLKELNQKLPTVKVTITDGAGAKKQ